MTKMFRFPNNILAAAFTAAVAANHQDINTDNLDACELSDLSTRLIVINDEEGSLFLEIWSEPESGAINVNTLAELEQAIGDALLIRSETGDDEDEINDPVGTVRIKYGDKGNPTEREIRIVPDGRVRVGCKWFTPEGAEEVIAAAKKIEAGKEIEDFETSYGDNEGKFLHHVSKVDGYDSLDFDGDDSESTKDVLRLAKIRERIMAKLPKAKARAEAQGKPFRIFPVKAKAAAKRKKVRRK